MTPNWRTLKPIPWAELSRLVCPADVLAALLASHEYLWRME